MPGCLQKQEDNMGYDIEGGNGGAWDAMQRGQKANAKEIKTDKYVEKIRMDTVTAVVRILRKIHDPNKLTQFQKDLALVATGIESLDWLKKEWS